MSQWAELLKIFHGVAIEDDKIDDLDKDLQRRVQTGMRLALLRPRLSAGTDDVLAVAMVHPHTELSDEVYHLDGCSTYMAAVQRRNERDYEHKTYTVIGPAYVANYRGREDGEIVELV